MTIRIMFVVDISEGGIKKRYTRHEMWPIRPNKEDYVQFNMNLFNVHNIEIFAGPLITVFVTHVSPSPHKTFDPKGWKPV